MKSIIKGRGKRGIREQAVVREHSLDRIAFQNERRENEGRV